MLMMKVPAFSELQRMFHYSTHGMILAPSFYLKQKQFLMINPT